MPVTLTDLLLALTSNALFLSASATLLTGYLLRLWAIQRPTIPVSANAARGTAIAVAFLLALLAYAAQVLRGTVAFTDEGVYQVLLLAGAVAGGSQTLYSGYKAVKGAVTPHAPPD